MPVHILRAQLDLEDVTWREAPDRTILTRRLWGAFQTALLGLGCIRTCVGKAAFNTGAQCVAGRQCPVFWLYKPRSVEQAREHTSPVRLHAAPTAGGRIELRLACFGRNAIAHLPLIQQALASSGQIGVDWDHRKIRYACRVLESIGSPLAELAKAPELQSLHLEFMTQCQIALPRLADIVGNTAHDIMQWWLFDSGASQRLHKRGGDRLADAVRSQGRRSVAALRCPPVEWSHKPGGRRRSKSNDGTLSFDGHLASIQLSGNLREAYPWLVLLALWGGGRKKSHGLGEVSLRAPGVPAFLQVGESPPTSADIGLLTSRTS